MLARLFLASFNQTGDMHFLDSTIVILDRLIPAVPHGDPDEGAISSSLMILHWPGFFTLGSLG